MNNERYITPDIAKGIAILLVVINHTGKGIYNSGVGESGFIWKNFHDVCYTFMVPVFFVISGYFIQKSNKGLKARCDGALRNVFYPYVIWTLVQSILLILTQAGNIKISWEDIPNNLLGGFMQFWFLHTLLIIMAYDLFARRVKLLPSFRLIIMLLVSLTVIIGLDMPRPVKEVAKHLVYFEVGVFVAPLIIYYKLRKRSVVVLVSSVIITTLLYLNGAGYGTNLRMAGALSGVVLCVALSQLLSRVSFVSYILRYCGEMSLQIYVLHVIFAAGLRVILLKLGVESFAIHFVLGIFLGVMAPLCLGWLDDKYRLQLFRFTFLNGNPVK